mmetsp:Transcript_11362/g.24959  ORF Transcript_11362/g.24959 Transcript_11362/m.24959 type:complete len:210 (-) Transcript_11362:1950-2579(-)
MSMIPSSTVHTFHHPDHHHHSHHHHPHPPHCPPPHHPHPPHSPPHPPSKSSNHHSSHNQQSHHPRPPDLCTDHAGQSYSPTCSAPRVPDRTVVCSFRPASCWRSLVVCGRWRSCSSCRRRRDRLGRCGRHRSVDRCSCFRKRRAVPNSSWPERSSPPSTCSNWDAYSARTLSARAIQGRYHRLWYSEEPRGFRCLPRRVHDAPDRNVPA